MVLLNRPFFHLSMADNVIAFRCSSVIYPHLLLSPSHFQNSLSTFSIERVNGMPLRDFYPSDFQRALKIIIIAELFIVMTISQGQLRRLPYMLRSRETNFNSSKRTCLMWLVFMVNVSFTQRIFKYHSLCLSFQ